MTSEKESSNSWLSLGTSLVYLFSLGTDRVFIIQPIAYSVRYMSWPPKIVHE